MTLTQDHNNNRWLVMDCAKVLKIFSYQPAVSRQHWQSLEMQKAQATAFIAEAAI